MCAAYVSVGAWTRMWPRINVTFSVPYPDLTYSQDFLYTWHFRVSQRTKSWSPPCYTLQHSQRRGCPCTWSRTMSRTGSGTPRQSLIYGHIEQSVRNRCEDDELTDSVHLYILWTKISWVFLMTMNLNTSAGSSPYAGGAHRRSIGW